MIMNANIYDTEENGIENTQTDYLLQMYFSFFDW